MGRCTLKACNLIAVGETHGYRNENKFCSTLKGSDYISRLQREDKIAAM